MSNVAHISQQPGNEKSQPGPIVLFIVDKGAERILDDYPGNPIVHGRCSESDRSGRSLPHNQNIVWQSAQVLFQSFHRLNDIHCPLAQQRATNPKGPFGGIVIRSVANSISRNRILSGRSQLRCDNSITLLAQRLSLFAVERFLRTFINVQQDSQLLSVCFRRQA
jgi:hypothetical protein